MMQADYSSDPNLYTNCMTLLDSCFPGIQSLADKGRTHNAFWDQSSTPFVIRHHDQIVAHLGVLPFELIIHEQRYRGAAFHGVCTHEAFRRKGYFRQLMTEALLHVKQHYDFAFLFTDQPHLYEPFGFKVVKEYDFIYEYTPQSIQENNIRPLDLNNPQDLAILQSRYLKRVPLSKAFSIINETTVATLNALHMPVYYLEELDVLVVYQIQDRILYLKEIIATKPYDLSIILKNMGNDFSKVVLQFIPDSFLAPPFHAVEAITDGCIMISQEFGLPCDYFRYPEPQRC